MESTSTITMVRLTPTNYNMWKPRMEDLLNLKDLAEPIEKQGVKPDTKTDEVWTRINNRPQCFSPCLSRDRRVQTLGEAREYVSFKDGTQQDLADEAPCKPQVTKWYVHNRAYESVPGSRKPTRCC